MEATQVTYFADQLSTFQLEINLIKKRKDLTDMLDADVDGCLECNKLRCSCSDTSSITSASRSSYYSTAYDVITGSCDSTGAGSCDSTGAGSCDSTGAGSCDSTGEGSCDSTGAGSCDSVERIRMRSVEQAPLPHTLPRPVWVEKMVLSNNSESNSEISS